MKNTDAAWCRANSLDLTAEQSQSLAAGQVVEVWERMEPQPPEDYSPSNLLFRSDAIVFVCELGERKDIIVPAPHLPGTRARVREPWRYDDTPGAYCNAPIESTTRVIYCDFELWDEIDSLVRPKSPSRLIREACTMPDWAIRMDAISTTTRVELREGVWGFVTGWVKA